MEATNTNDDMLNISFKYPFSKEYVYETWMERINLDEEREYDIKNDNGFIVVQSDKLKKNLGLATSIFSPKFGQQLQDTNPSMDKYQCECGYTRSRIHHNMICEICNTPVRFVDDNFSYFGWITLQEDFYIIHPNLYKSISMFMGSHKGVSRLENIISIIDNKDMDGYSIKEENVDKDEPFKGIGISEFRLRFQEIMDFYLTKATPTKREYYKDIMENKDKVFIKSIPVFTTLLRPYQQDAKTFAYHDVSALYNMMARLASKINVTSNRMARRKKPKEILLYDLQMKYNELYKELQLTLSGKKGVVRQLIGGRFSFTSRLVITGDATLKSDEIKLSYFALCELLQQSIINILQKTYGMSYSEAYKSWEQSMIHEDKIIRSIIQTIIDNHERGIPVLINRPPTISYGSILQMFVIGINDSYTMTVPLTSIISLAADFDGDCLTILYIINKAFFEAAYATLNPRNAFMISKNDGLCNMDMIHQRDIIIAMSSIINLTRDRYTQEEINKIMWLKSLS